MMAQFFGTIGGSAIGCALVYVGITLWQERRERRMEHEIWNAEIPMDIAGGLDLTEEDRFMLDIVENSNPDLLDLDDCLLDDDDGEEPLA
jgi:hypothetical protein